MFRACARRYQKCPWDGKLPPAVNPYPTFDPKNPGPAHAQHGPLSFLHGEWENVPGVYGMHTTIMPSPGTDSEQIFGAFHFKSQQYTEKLKFKKEDGAIRNRGGTNEQFSGLTLYDTVIRDRNDVIQHIENGMYLFLGAQPGTPADGNQQAEYQDPPNLYTHPASEASVKEDFAYPVVQPGQKGAQFVPPYSISRQGSIPHGTTIHLMGNHKHFLPQGEKGASSVPAPEFWAGQAANPNQWDPTAAPAAGASLAIDPTMGLTGKQLNALTPNNKTKPEFASFPISKDPCSSEKGVLNAFSGEAYVQRIFNYEEVLNNGDKGAAFPFTVQPNLLLVSANERIVKDFCHYDLISLDTVQDTGLQGGVLQNVMVDRYCRTTRMQLKMWLERVVDLASGETVDQLQYQQIVDFEFGFGTNGGKTRWPHIQVNTLRRVKN